MHEAIKKSEQSIDEKLALTQNIIMESDKKMNAGFAEHGLVPE